MTQTQTDSVYRLVAVLTLTFSVIGPNVLELSWKTNVCDILAHLDGIE